MKKISRILLLSFALYNTHPLIIANDENEESHYIDESDIFGDSEDDFNFDDTLDFGQDALQDYIPVVQKRTITSNTDDWAALLLALGDNNIILNQSLYKRTSPIRTRSILDYPFALTYGFDLQDTSAFSVMLYGNISWPKNFTKNSQLLSSYLKTEDVELINILEDILEENPLDNPINIGEALKLFSPGKVVELRAGFLLESHVDFDTWNLNIQLPLQYVARAFYLTPEERELVFNSDLAKYFETEDNLSQDEFYYQNFYVDQFGMGDLKFKAMYQLHQAPSIDVYLGGFVILPIATPFQQGIYGTWFDQNNDRAYLDLRTINPQAVTLQNQDDVAAFFMAALDKLNSNILYPLLGNNGHVVIAPSCNFDWYFANNWKFCSDDSFEIPLRAYEQRFYKAVQSNNDFTAEFNSFVNNDDTNGLVLFANQKIQDMFFPFVYTTLVLPGLIVNSTNQFVVYHDQWNMQFGGNYWYQAKEQITAPVLPANYDLAVVPASSVAQGKIFGKFNYDIHIENNIVALSAYTDITVWNSGIGNDYTLGLSLDYKF